MNKFVTLIAADPSAVPAGTGWSTIIMMVIFIVLFYFLLIRPQRKKEKKDAQMRKNIQIGDEVVTAGGIIGIVCKLEEDSLVIETGGDRSKLRIKRWAVSQNVTAETDDNAKKNASKTSKKEDSIEKD